MKDLGTEKIEYELHRYLVEAISATGAFYLVESSYAKSEGIEMSWTCSCMDYQARKRSCKHIREIQEDLKCQ